MEIMNAEEGSPEGGGLKRRPEFSVTSWTLISKARDPASPEAAAALERLCNSYWYPLYAYARRRGFDAGQAEDLTQEFFYRLLKENYLKVVDRERGKFRTFLLCAMMHFLSNERARAGAAKRGGGKVVLSLDEELAESRYLKDTIADPSAGRMFEHAWASTLLEQVREGLRAEYNLAGKTNVFAAMEPFLRDDTGSGDYPKVAQELGMTPGAVAVAVHRLRQRFGKMLREAVAETLADPSPAAVEEEMRHLQAALGD